MNNQIPLDKASRGIFDEQNNNRIFTETKILSRKGTASGFGLDVALQRFTTYDLSENENETTIKT